MEQPEIHLHPSVQGKLADLFVQAVQCKEYGKDKGLQLIIESHSEHFLRRLQRLVAEAAIPRENVMVYFCEVREGASVLVPLEMDESGNIVRWPENFFGDPM
jgi:predicted ATPase